MKKLFALLPFLFCVPLIAGMTKAPLPPAYDPPAQTGVIRLWGHPSLAAIAKRWQAAYALREPDIRIELHFEGSDVAMAGLYTGQADVALLSRRATASEIQAFEWVYQYKPARVEILTGSFDRPGSAAALVVMVNAANPLTALTLDQLNAVFSYDRARGSGAAIIIWGQVGLGGEWQNRPINLYSFDTDAGSGRYFREAALGGSRHLHWNRLREVKADPRRYPHALAAANRTILDMLARDRYGLAVASVGYAGASVKALALAPCATCVPVAASRASVASRHYPLARSVSAYFHRSSEQPIDQRVEAFLRYILSPSGQAALGNDAAYLPLDPRIAAEQAASLP